MNSIECGLTGEQVARYRDEGYVVVPDLLSDAEIDAFMTAAARPQPEPYGLHGHMKDAQYHALATHPNVIAIVSQLLGGRPRIVQTMFLNKPAQGGKGI